MEGQKSKETHGQAKPGRVKNRTKEIALAILVASIIAVILVGILVLKLPALPVILIVALEIGIAFCLQRVPLIVHGVICAVLIIVGAVTGNAVFMVIGALLYFCAVLAVGMVFYKRGKARPQ